MIRSLTCLSMLIVILSADSAGGQDASAPYMTRTSIQHFAGGGVGHTSGYSSLDWFLPLSAQSDTTMWFGDFRGLVFNDAEFGSNVGSGFRWFVDDQNRIYGVNAYWDTRQDNSMLFNQAGIGVESMGEYIDFRANAYTPGVNDTLQKGNVFFVGSGLARPSTAALSGLDAEAGFNFPAFSGISTRVFGGGYYFDSNHTVEAAGWRVRLEAAFRDDLMVGVAAQDDKLFGQTINAMIELRSVFYHHNTPAARSMRHKFRRANGAGDGVTVQHRLADPVYRQRNIVLKHLYDNFTAPGGAPLNILHVVPGGTGNGTIENPFGTISDAMLDPRSATGIVYTPSGGLFTENVTMVPGSRLLSTGTSQLVATSLGDFAMPGSGRGTPLDALPAIVNGNVALADNSIFSGFRVTGGVTGNTVSNVQFTDNHLASAPADALTLTGVDNVTVSNVLVTNPGQRGIFLSDTSATLSEITIQNPGSTALQVDTSATDRIVTVSGLSSAGNNSSGLDVNLTGAGNLQLDVSSSSISSRLDAVNIATLAGSTGSADVRLNNLTTSSTNASGIVVDGTAGTGAVTVNRFSNNTVSRAAAGAVLFDQVTFDANSSAPGNQPVLAGSLNLGTTTADIVGTGLSVVNSNGVLNLGVAKIFNNNGPGVIASASPSLTLASSTESTVTTLNDAAIDLSNVRTNLVFSSLTSTDSPGANHGIHLNGVTGSINSTTTNIVRAQSSAILIENIAAAPNTLTARFGALQIRSTIDNTEASNIELPGVTTGIVQPVYTSLNILFP